MYLRKSKNFLICDRMTRIDKTIVLSPEFTLEDVKT